MTNAILIIETGDRRGEQCPVTGPSVRIGRDPDNQIVLEDDAITAHHARIDVRGKRYRVMDLGSLNGTLVNGVRVQLQELQDGDRVQLGRVRLHFQRTTGPARVSEPGSDAADFEQIVQRFRTTSPTPRDPRSLAAAHYHLRVILELSEQIAMFYDVDEVLQQGVDTCVKSFDADRVVLLLREGRNGQMQPRATHTAGALPVISVSVLEQVVGRQQAVRIDDAQRDDRYRNQDSVATENIRSVLCVPLRTDAGIVGACYMDRVDTDVPFQQEHLQLATLVANVLGQRLEHIRLYHETLEVETLKVLNLEMAETNAKLLDLEQFKSDMVNMLVHDMKGPVATTMMSLDVVGLDPGGALSDQAREFLAVAKRSQYRLNEMIMNLLELSRLEEGALQPAIAEIAVEDLLRRFLEGAEPYARAARINIQVHVQAGMTLWSDATLVERMLQNLVMNAVNHSKADTTVTIRASLEEEIGHLAVEDQGEGIPEELYERIFERFAQAEVRDLGLKSDVGLGLAFCKLAAETLGGEVSVTSVVGKGSTFTISLPSQVPE